MDLVRHVLESILFVSLVAHLPWTSSRPNLLLSTRVARTFLLVLAALLFTTLSVPVSSVARALVALAAA
jgi:hypothetical protein